MPAGCRQTKAISRPRRRGRTNTRRRTDVERRLELAGLHRGYVPPAGLTLSRPRDVRLSTSGRFLFGLAILFFAGAIAASVGLWLDASSKFAQKRMLESEGIDTTATVVGLTRRKDDKKTPVVIYR